MTYSGFDRIRVRPLSKRTFPEGVAGKLRFTRKNAGSELRAAQSRGASRPGSPTSARWPL